MFHKSYFISEHYSISKKYLLYSKVRHNILTRYLSLDNTFGHKVPPA